MEKKHTILIVDRSKPIIERIFLLLGELENVASIKHATSYVEALDIIDNSDVDVAIIDAHLPQGGIIDVLKKIKAKASPAVLIIVMSDHEVDNEQLLLTLGADYLIDKFGDFEEIPKIISNLKKLKTAHF